MWDICWYHYFCDSLISHLGDAERVEADDGYIGEAPKHVKCPKSFTNKAEMEFMQQRVRNRKETTNNRFKTFGILRQIYRHHIPSHGEVFRAVAVMKQLSINDGEKRFVRGYRDGPFAKRKRNDNR